MTQMQRNGSTFTTGTLTNGHRDRVTTANTIAHIHAYLNDMSTHSAKHDWHSDSDSLSKNRQRHTTPTLYRLHTTAITHSDRDTPTSMGQSQSAPVTMA